MALDKIRTELIADDAVTAAKIPTGAIGTTEIAEGALSVHALQNTTSHTLSGTYSESKLYTSDAYVLGGDTTVNSNLVLSSVKGDDSDITLTTDSTTRTITGTGKLEGGALVATQANPTNTLTGMTGELGSSVTVDSAATWYKGVDTDRTAFRVGMSTSPEVASATFTLAPLDTVAFDLGSNFTDTSTYKYTVPITGYYHIMGSLQLNSWSGYGNNHMTSVYVNGSRQHDTDFNQPSKSAESRMEIPTYLAFVVHKFSYIAYYEAGDYLQLYGYVERSGGSTGTRTMGNSPMNSWMAGYKIS